MARRVRVSTWYARAAARVLCDGSLRGNDIGRTVRLLAAADAPPGPADYEATSQPVGRAWVRRVGGHNVWVWYRVNDDEVILVTVTTDPPIPLDD